MYGDGPDFDILFHKIDGMAARRGQVEGAAKEVDSFIEKDVSSKTDDDIVSAIQEKLSVKVPTLKRDDISFERKMKTVERRDIWGEYGRVELPVFYFDVPYDGEDVIFTMQPSSWSTNPPRGEARRGILRIAVVGEEDAAKLQHEVKSTLDRVEVYLTSHRQMWSGLEDEIATVARRRLAQRREKLSALGQAEAGLEGMGFKPKGA
jgi:hypothetical protein